VYGGCVNAVERFASALAPESLRRVAALEPKRFDRAIAPRTRGPIDLDEALLRVTGRWAADLCGLLNALTRGELAQLARAERVECAAPATDEPRTVRSPDLRVALWERGAWLERGGGEIGAALQPRPVVLGGHLVVLGVAAGAARAGRGPAATRRAR